MAFVMAFGILFKGCPSTGLYGHNCSIPCPDINCKYCHPETGTCQGCKPGYKGHHCELGNICLHPSTKMPSISYQK